METSAISRALTAFLALTRAATAFFRSRTPSPCRADVAITGTPSSPSWASSRFTSSTIEARRSAGTSSMWLRTTSMISLWVASGLR